MGYQESFLKFKNASYLAFELNKYIEEKIKYEKDTSCGIVVVGRAIKSVYPFKRGEYFLKLSGERFPQSSTTNLEEELGIKNVEEIVFTDNELYITLSRKSDVSLSKWLNSHFEYLTTKEIEKILKVNYKELVRLERIIN